MAVTGFVASHIFEKIITASPAALGGGLQMSLSMYMSHHPNPLLLPTVIVMNILIVVEGGWRREKEVLLDVWKHSAIASLGLQVVISGVVRGRLGLVCEA